MTILLIHKHCDLSELEVSLDMSLQLAFNLLVLKLATDGKGLLVEEGITTSVSSEDGRASLGEHGSRDQF